MSWKTASEQTRATRSIFRRAPSLAALLTTWYAVSAFALVAAASWLLFIALERSLAAENERLLSERMAQVREFLRNRRDAATKLLEELAKVNTPRQHTPVFTRVLDGDDKVIVESPGMATILAVAAFPTSAPADGGAISDVLRSQTGHRFQLLTGAASPPPDVDEPNSYTVQLALPLAPQEKLLSAYRRRLWLTLSVALLVSVGVGYEIARRGIRPIQQVTEVATKTRSSTLNARIDSRSMPAEIQSLAGEFNLMLDRLQESFARISRFSADIAHELRTPVTNLRGVAEVALTKARSREEYHEALSSTIEESLRLSHIIENLLFLARAEDPAHQVARETLDVSRELAAVAEFYEASASEAGVKIDVKVEGPMPARINRTLFQRAVGNLLDNSIKHTPSGGRISIGASRANGALRIEVLDTGRGIPPQHLPRVFDRLYRVQDDRAKSTGGVGLGLAIVKSIAASHGGSVEIVSREGEGTRVTITMPIDATADPRPSRFG